MSQVHIVLRNMQSSCSEIMTCPSYKGEANWGLYVCCMGLPVIIVSLYILIAEKKHKKKIEETFMKAYALGMVDTYFYGYLRKIIPNEGSNSPSSRGIVERIRLYKDKHGLSSEEFPSNKIFILVSEEGYIMPCIDMYDEHRIERRQNLDPIEWDRAGVNGRKYMSSVYKIMFRGGTNHISVVLEGAPPLLVLYDSCQENSELKKYKKRIIKLFYNMLSAKMNEKAEFRDAYELIYFGGDDKSLADIIIKSVIESSR